jgi:hypothetical protein
MKIAIVFNGQPRWIKEAFEFNKKSLLDPNQEHEIDVFAHFWFDDSKIGKSCSEEIERSPNKGKAVWSQSLIDDFKNLWQPTRLSVESPFDRSMFSEDFYTTGGSFCGFEATSMFCSIKKAMALKTAEEISTGQKYDLVLRARPDLAIIKPIKFDDISKDTITILNSGLPTARNHAFNCDFAVGNSRTMDVYAGIFDNIEEYIAEGCRFYGESLVFWHLYKNQFSTRSISSGTNVSGNVIKNEWHTDNLKEVDLGYIKRDGGNWQGLRQHDCWIIRDPSLH